MTDAKHTPGPSLAHQLYCELGICNGDARCFSGAHKDVRDRREQAIEKIFGSAVYAAPDLLAELERLRPIIHAFSVGKHPEERDEMMGNIDAAIAKATGGP